ncbi:hypothetical protein PCE1_003311 [Barthelona sp. PCE]
MEPPVFNFKPRTGRVDWSLIWGIDISEMISNVDVDALQEILPTVAFSDIESEAAMAQSDPNLVKLFQLSQYIIEYMLHGQYYLQHENEELSEQNEKLMTTVSDQKNALTRLRREILELKGMEPCGDEIVDSYRCEFCGKLFGSMDYLYKHISKTHPQHCDDNMVPILTTEPLERNPLMRKRTASQPEPIAPVVSVAQPTHTVQTSYQPTDVSGLTEGITAANSSIDSLASSMMEMKYNVQQLSDLQSLSQMPIALREFKCDIRDFMSDMFSRMEQNVTASVERSMREIKDTQVQTVSLINANSASQAPWRGFMENNFVHEKRPVVMNDIPVVNTVVEEEESTIVEPLRAENIKSTKQPTTAKRTVGSVVTSSEGEEKSEKGTDIPTVTLPRKKVVIGSVLGPASPQTPKTESLTGSEKSESPESQKSVRGNPTTPLQSTDNEDDHDPENSAVFKKPETVSEMPSIDIPSLDLEDVKSEEKETNEDFYIPAIGGTDDVHDYSSDEFDRLLAIEQERENKEQSDDVIVRANAALEKTSDVEEEKTDTLVNDDPVEVVDIPNVTEDKPVDTTDTVLPVDKGSGGLDIEPMTDYVKNLGEQEKVEPLSTSVVSDVDKKSLGALNMTPAEPPSLELFKADLVNEGLNLSESLDDENIQLDSDLNTPRNNTPTVQLESSGNVDVSPEIPKFDFSKLNLKSRATNEEKPKDDSLELNEDDFILSETDLDLNTTTLSFN